MVRGTVRWHGRSVSAGTLQLHKVVRGGSVAGPTVLPEAGALPSRSTVVRPSACVSAGKNKKLTGSNDRDGESGDSHNRFLPHLLHNC